MYTSCTLVHLSINVHLYMVDRKSVSPDKNLKAFLGVSAKGLDTKLSQFSVNTVHSGHWE